MDTLLLSRLQFGALTAFHLLFPAMTLALGWVLLVFRLRARRTGAALWTRAFRFWTPVYTMSVAFQVVSGWALWTQFHMTWPGFMEQAHAVVLPLRNLAMVGAALQVLPLAAAAFGVRIPSRSLVTWLIGCSALGGALSLFALVMMVGWMVDPVGQYAQSWHLAAGDWLALFTNPQAWLLLARVALASGVAVGLLLLAVSVLRAMAAGHGCATDVTAKTGLMLAASSALLALILGVWTVHPLIIPALALVVSLTASGLLLVLRRPESGLQRLPQPVLLATLAAPFGGWALTLVSWPFDRMLHSAWLIHGQMRVDDAAAVLPPGAVNATLPVYLLTIAFLTATYVLVLVTMARRGAQADQAQALLDARALRRVG